MRGARELHRRLKQHHAIPSSVLLSGGSMVAVKTWLTNRCRIRLIAGQWREPGRFDTVPLRSEDGGAAMATPIPVIRNLATLRRRVAGFRQSGEKIALVPTMGALHAGHLALVRQRGAGPTASSCRSSSIRRSSLRNEDFATYPRTFAYRSCRARQGEGRSRVGAAGGTDVSGRLRHPHRAGRPCRRRVSRTSFRPHFFSGVATVVAKLFLQVPPDVAMFGEKDYQQLKVVTPHGP